MKPIKSTTSFMQGTKKPRTGAKKPRTGPYYQNRARRRGMFGATRRPSSTRGHAMHRTTDPLPDGLAVPYDLVPAGPARAQLAEWRRVGLSVSVYYRLRHGYTLQVGQHRMLLDSYLRKYALASRVEHKRGFRRAKRTKNEKNEKKRST